MYEPVANFLIDASGEAIIELQDGPNALPNFYVVDTRGLLNPAESEKTGNSNDWLNEIHPNSTGYNKIAKPISALIRKKLDL